MENKNYTTNSSSNLDSSFADFSIREELDKYFFYWRWFVVSVVACLVAAFLYLRYATPIYSASTTILVKDDKKGGLASEFSGLSEIGLLGKAKSNVDNEVEILKSRTLIEKAVKELRLNYIYIKEGLVKAPEIYNGSEVIIDYTSNLPEERTKVKKFKIEGVSNTQFKLIDGLDKERGTYNYNQTIPLTDGKLTVVKNPRFDHKVSYKDFSIVCAVYPVHQVVSKYTNGLGVNLVGKNTSVLQLSFQDAVPERAEDFLDALVTIYNNEAIADKNLVSEKTSDFIAKRLQLITDELTVVEKDVESFKKSNNLTDIPSEAEMYLENSSLYEKSIIDTQIQQNVVSSIINFFKKSNTTDLIPSNLITGESEANSLITQYNKLVLERNKAAKGATDLNPIVVNLDQQIKSLKANVSQSLQRLQSNLEIKRRSLNNQDNMLSGKKRAVPTLERKFRVIDRQQRVKEELYLYLLQKREETSLSLAATENNAKVIDAAKASVTPVSPKKMIIFLIALVIGLVIPFVLIYLNDLLNTKIKTRLELDKRLQIPFLGDIPRSESHEEMMNTNSRSSSAEAIRIVRTNLEFMLSKVVPGKAKTVFVTSTIPGEGKTFVSVNVAGTIALSGKKVLLVGLDIRNPKLAEYWPINPKGVTNYLSGKENNLKELITPLKNYKNFDVLSSGIIPPNPVELLMDDRITKMFDELKSLYDYIIVDTAPVSLVTDTILVANNADAFIYVVRANYLDRRMLRVPEMFYNEKKLPNMSMVLNDTKLTNKGYGYGYGYGYGNEQETKKPWYKTLLGI
ncbi:GumC family protein [Flavobacterium sp.]|jgi:tyrosine-protein kinase Etk/Wzc|uniref:GumC family protein n=1 Tax=Flavobacterium sp. TaxID=239 RepID=UPI0037C0D610